MPTISFKNQTIMVFHAHYVNKRQSNHNKVFAKTNCFGSKNILPVDPAPCKPTTVGIPCHLAVLNITNLQISAPFLCVQVQTKEIERIFRYGWTLCDGGALLLHEAEQLFEERPPIGVIIHLVKPREAVRAPGGRLCNGKKTKKHSC